MTATWIAGQGEADRIEVPGLRGNVLKHLARRIHVQIGGLCAMIRKPGSCVVEFEAARSSDLGAIHGVREPRVLAGAGQALAAPALPQPDPCPDTQT